MTPTQPQLTRRWYQNRGETPTSSYRRKACLVSGYGAGFLLAGTVPNRRGGPTCPPAGRPCCWPTAVPALPGAARGPSSPSPSTGEGWGGPPTVVLDTGVRVTPPRPSIQLALGGGGPPAPSPPIPSPPVRPHQAGNPEGRRGTHHRHCYANSARPPRHVVLRSPRRRTWGGVGLDHAKRRRYFHPLMWPSQGHRHFGGSRNPDGRGSAGLPSPSPSTIPYLPQRERAEPAPVPDTGVRVTPPWAAAGLLHLLPSPPTLPLTLDPPHPGPPSPWTPLTLDPPHPGHPSPWTPLTLTPLTLDPLTLDTPHPGPPSPWTPLTLDPPHPGPPSPWTPLTLDPPHPGPPSPWTPLTLDPPHPRPPSPSTTPHPGPPSDNLHPRPSPSLPTKNLPIPPPSLPPFPTNNQQPSPGPPSPSPPTTNNPPSPALRACPQPDEGMSRAPTREPAPY